jgi:hypothetical protein
VQKLSFKLLRLPYIFIWKSLSTCKEWVCLLIVLWQVAKMVNSLMFIVLSKVILSVCKTVLETVKKTSVLFSLFLSQDCTFLSRYTYSHCTYNDWYYLQCAVSCWQASTHSPTLHFKHYNFVMASLFCTESHTWHHNHFPSASHCYFTFQVKSLEERK